MKLLLCFVGFAAIAYSDLPGLIKQKQRREIIMYIMVYLLVLGFAALALFDFKAASPIKMIQTFYRDFLHLSF